jgi:ubiquinone/menaquinone biosynthesis C-methylase UbiE
MVNGLKKNILLKYRYWYAKQMKPGLNAKQLKHFTSLSSSCSLGKFKEILKELLDIYEDIDRLESKDILELGPGKNLNLLHFLDEKTKAGSVTGVGREPEWLWIKDRKFRENKVVNQFLPGYLKKVPDKCYDIIYSRYFFEKFSINPRILIGSKIYWKYVWQNRFNDQQEDFPASIKNLEAVFKEAVRILKPGGVIISQIAKKYYSILSPEFLKSFKFKKIHRRSLSKISEIVTVIRE